MAQDVGQEPYFCERVIFEFHISIRPLLLKGYIIFMHMHIARNQLKECLELNTS